MTDEAPELEAAIEQRLIEAALMEHGVEIRRSPEAMAMIRGAARQAGDQIRRTGGAMVVIPHLPLPNGRFIALRLPLTADELTQGAWIPDEGEIEEELAGPSGPSGSPSIDPAPIVPENPLGGLLRWVVFLLFAAAFILEFLARRG